jgi:uncharacterized protein
MKVVSNSSVLIALSAIGRLELLPKKFTQGIIIPGAVWEEVVVTGHGLPGAKSVTDASWINRQLVADITMVFTLRASLDKGEAEVIALAREIKADILLLDEKSTRNIARRFNYTVLGTVGVLIWAKRQGLIHSLSADLEALQQKGGFRLGKNIFHSALTQVGEE